MGATPGFGRGHAVGSWGRTGTRGPSWGEELRMAGGVRIGRGRVGAESCSQMWEETPGN